MFGLRFVKLEQNEYIHVIKKGRVVKKAAGFRFGFINLRLRLLPFRLKQKTCRSCLKSFRVIIKR